MQYYSADPRVAQDSYSDYIVQPQKSCNIVQTQGLCNSNLTSIPRVVQLVFISVADAESLL